MPHLKTSVVHFHPTFFSGFFKRRFPSRDKNALTPFNLKTSPFWPLLAVVVPPLLNMYQVDFLELIGNARMPFSSPQTPPGLLIPELEFHSTDILCYSTLYLGSPRMMRTPRLGNGSIWWRAVREDVVRDFRRRVFRLAGVERATSRFCSSTDANGERSRAVVAPNGTVSWTGVAPSVLLIRRVKTRVLLNEKEVMAAIRQFGFNLSVIQWENFDIWEQIRASRLADAIVGVHGNSILRVLV